MSLQVRSDVSLKHYNTFGIDVDAKLFAEAHSDEDVRQALAYAAQLPIPLLVIGGGSNLLLTGDVQALVLRMATRGIRVLSDDGSKIVIEAEAGEPWHITNDDLCRKDANGNPDYTDPAAFPVMYRANGTS